MKSVPIAQVHSSLRPGNKVLGNKVLGNKVLGNKVLDRKVLDRKRPGHKLLDRHQNPDKLKNLEHKHPDKRK